MKNELQHINISNFKTSSGRILDIPLSYQVFGKPLHSAPIVLVNHALTGNSDISGENGWWKTLAGENKVIDTEYFTVLAFNIPGNGFDGFLLDDYQIFTLKDVAKIIIEGLDALNIQKLYTIIGGSIGGALGWEILGLKPNLAQKFIPIATDYKTADWLNAQCLVQKFLLENETHPIEKARIHAMLCYRTPESLNQRFNREIDADKPILKSEDWLDYHGKALEKRFSLQSYQLMNHLLMNINVSEQNLAEITSEIHLVSVDTDLFFPASEIRNTYDLLLKNQQNVHYHEIKSINGHDAFLMEYEQLNTILTPIFENNDR